MSSKEITSKTIEILKHIDKNDYLDMVNMFGDEETCIKYVSSAATKHPDMIISLLEGLYGKTENKKTKEEIENLLRCLK